MGDMGIKISKPGKSATSTNLYDYNLWSKNPVGKIAEEGNGSGATGSTVAIDYSANAGNNSVWVPYISDDNSNWYLGGIAAPYGYGYSSLEVSNFNISLGGAGTDYYKYFVLEDAWA